jgi:hypothetical protein
MMGGWLGWGDGWIAGGEGRGMVELQIYSYLQGIFCF